MKILILLAVVSAVYAQKGCGDGSLIKELKNFTEAQEHCRKLGQQLLVPTNDLCVENLFFQMLYLKIRRVWIGLSRRFDVNDSDIKTFRWEGEQNENKPIGDYWGPKEPNNFRKHQERCVEVRYLPKNSPKLNWNDAPCDHLNFFYCENLK